MRESKIENRFIVRMAKLGWMHHKGSSKRGYADQFFYGFGARTVIVEFKRDGAPKKRKGEKLQKYFREEFQKRGFDTYKVVGLEISKKVFFSITGEKYEDVKDAHVRRKSVGRSGVGRRQGGH